MTKNQTERGYLNISKMVFAFAGGMVVSAATLPLVNFFGGDSAAWQKTFLIYGVVAIVFFLVVFAIMFIVLMFYKLDKEYDGIITDLAARDQKA